MSKIMWEGTGSYYGLEVSTNDFSKLVQIEPIASNGKVTGCLTLPIDKVDELIEALKAARGLQINDKVKTLKPFGDIPAGTFGTLVDRVEGKLILQTSAKYGAVTINPEDHTALFRLW